MRIFIVYKNILHNVVRIFLHYSSEFMTETVCQLVCWTMVPLFRCQHRKCCTFMIITVLLLLFENVDQGKKKKSQKNEWAFLSVSKHIFRRLQTYYIMKTMKISAESRSCLSDSYKSTHRANAANFMFRHFTIYLSSTYTKPAFNIAATRGNSALKSKRRLLLAF